MANDGKAADGTMRGIGHDLTLDEFEEVWCRVAEEDGTIRDVSEVLGMPISTIYGWRRDVNRRRTSAKKKLLPNLRRANSLPSGLL